jgi:hypothetical protein
MEVSGQLHAPVALPQGKSPWYPLDRRLGGPQSRSGRGGLEKNSQPPQGIEPQNPAAQRYTEWAVTALVKVKVNSKVVPVLN